MDYVIMSTTKLIYNRTRLASNDNKPYYKVIYDEVESGERNKEKIIKAKTLNEADAKFHEMESNPDFNIRKKIRLMAKLVYKSKTSMQKSFSRTGDFFIAIGEALSSKNPKAELDKLAKKYDMQRKDLKEAVETYIKYDLDSNGLDDNDVKHILKEVGFSEGTKEYWVLYEYKSPMAKSSTKHELEDYIQKHHGGSPTKEAYTIKKVKESELSHGLPGIDDIDY